ncbi:MAG TPA: DinB family protein [Dehalococcoidia bacterium]|nr:DinB family protein [Dehalococcoidia bacterium]
MDLEITYERDADGKKLSSSIPDRNKEWVLAFVAEHSVKSPAEIETVVQAAHDEMMAAIEGLSEEQASWRTADGEWSVLEAMAHLVTTKRTMAGLARTLAAGQRPPGAEQFEEMAAQDGQVMVSPASLAEARQMAEEAHERWLAVIRALDTADTETRFKHYIFGAMNAREWSVFQAVHDGDHTPQMLRVRGAPGFPA